MKAIWKITALLCQVGLFQKSAAQNELIGIDTSSSTNSIASITNTILINSSPCNTLYFDKEVISMEAGQLRESYDLLLDKYENLKHIIKRYQKVIEEYNIIPSEQVFSCSNNINPSVPCGDAFIEPLVPQFTNENTVITYFIPETGKDSKLCISDTHGKLVLEYNLDITGYGQVIIPAGKLNHGVFNYCLILDANKMDCKKMIVMK